MSRYLLHLDFETTDLDFPQLVEAAFMLTTPQLDIVEPLTSFVFPWSSDDSREAMPSFVYQMHSDSGLVNAADTAYLAGLQRTDVIARIGTLIDGWVKRHDISHLTIAGSGVSHFDDDIFMATWPQFADLLTYYSMDVGHLRRAYHDATGQHYSPANDAKTHRAGDDVMASYTEMQDFKALLRRSGPPLDR